MATFNGEKYLKEQLDSIYAQSYINLQVIVTDDCSTDGTIKILEAYAHSHGLQYFINDTNLGYVKNFEKAISLCKGDYIALADQDDIWEPDKLETLLNAIEDNLLIHSDCSIIDDNNRLIAPNWKKDKGFNIKTENLLRANVVTGCSVLFKKALLKTAYPFPGDIVYHDWWLALCAADVNKICYISSPLTRYRQHGDQDTGSGLTNPFKKFFTNIYKRQQNIDYERIIGIRKQRQNLLAIRKNNISLNIQQDYLNAVISYFDNYLNHTFHIKAFFISLRYHKLFYPRNNFLFIKNFLYDIIG